MPSSLTGRSTLSHHHYPIKQDAQQPPHFPGSAAGSKEVKMTREEESGNKSRRSLRSPELRTGAGAAPPEPGAGSGGLGRVGEPVPVPVTTGTRASSPSEPSPPREPSALEMETGAGGGGTIPREDEALHVWWSGKCSFSRFPFARGRSLKSAACGCPCSPSGPEKLPLCA